MVNTTLKDREKFKYRLLSKVMVCDKIYTHNLLLCVFSSLFFIGNTTNFASHKEACPTNVNETIFFDKSIYTIVSEVRL